MFVAAGVNRRTMYDLHTHPVGGGTIITCVNAGRIPAPTLAVGESYGELSLYKPVIN